MGQDEQQVKWRFNIDDKVVMPHYINDKEVFCVIDKINDRGHKILVIQGANDRIHEIMECNAELAGNPVEEMSIEELREDNFKLSAMGCEAPYGDDYGNHRCRSIDYWRTRALLAEKLFHKPPIGHHDCLQYAADRSAYNKFIEENKEP